MVSALKEYLFPGPTVDRDAFELRMRESQRAVYSLALRLTGNSSDAEDLTQEAFVRAFRFFHRYDSGMPFTSWMYRIVTNCHIDALRRRGKVRTTSLDHSGAGGEATWDVADDTSSPERLILEPALEDAWQLGLMAMSPDFRTAVVLADIEELAYEEIAEIMATSVGTVRSRIHRGRKQLRAYMERSYPAAAAAWAEDRS